MFYHTLIKKRDILLPNQHISLPLLGYLFQERPCCYGKCLTAAVNRVSCYGVEMAFPLEAGVHSVWLTLFFLGKPLKGNLQTIPSIPGHPDDHDRVPVQHRHPCAHPSCQLHIHLPSGEHTEKAVPVHTAQDNVPHSLLVLRHPQEQGQQALAFLRKSGFLMMEPQIPAILHISPAFHCFPERAQILQHIKTADASLKFQPNLPAAYDKDRFQAHPSGLILGQYLGHLPVGVFTDHGVGLVGCMDGRL